MGRIAGRSGRLYINLTSGGTPEPLTFLRTWSISFSTDNIDVSAMGDTNKVYVSSLPDCSGSYAGVYDDATVQTYTAASDGIARKFYLYPNNGSTSQYFFGTAIFDFSAEASHDGSVNISGDFAAASAVTKIG